MKRATTATRDHALALGILVVAAAILLRPLLTTGSTHILTDDFQAGPGRSDAYTFLWGHWWVHTALSEGELPFFCDRVFPPTGADLRFHTVPWVPALLTWPLSAFARPVPLYNLGIAGLLVGAAFVMYLSLRVTFRLRFGVAVLFGALFGFCPYLVFKVHAHPNLAGAVFWGAALALLVHAILRGSAGWRPAVAFAAAFWLCFWNSLVEVVMLGVAATVTILAAAAGRRLVERRPLRFAPAARWLAVLAVGAPSVLFFLRGADEGLERSLFPPPSADVWLGFPLSSLFSSGVHDGRFFEYAGTGIPWGIAVLAGLGLWTGGGDRRARAILGLTLAGLILLMLDPGGVLSGVVRTLPFGEAVRVFARFFPFALFFAVTAAAVGVDRTFRGPRSPAGLSVVVVATLFAGLETWPRTIHPSPVVSLNVPTAVRDAMDESRFVLVLPLAPKSYPRRREAYQVELGLPFVHMGHLTREDPETVRRRTEAFPLFYGDVEAAAGLTPEGLRDELDRLGVSYLLFDRPEPLARLPLKGEILHRTEREILLRLPPPGKARRAPGRRGDDPSLQE